MVAYVYEGHSLHTCVYRAKLGCFGKHLATKRWVKDSHDIW